VKAVSPTQEEVDAAAKEKYEPKVNAYVNQLEGDYNQKIADIQAKCDRRLKKAEEEMEKMKADFPTQDDVNEAATKQYGQKVADLEGDYNKKIADLQAKYDKKIAAAEEKMKLRRETEEGEAWLRQAAAGRQGPRSYVTGGSAAGSATSRKPRKFEDPETGKVIEKQPLEAVLNGPFEWAIYTGNDVASFPKVVFDLNQTDQATARVVIKRAPDTEGGFSRVFNGRGEERRCKSRTPWQRATDVVQKSIKDIPEIKDTLMMSKTADVFAHMTITRKGGSSQASNASTTMETE
jgi:hypothetical protein